MGSRINEGDIYKWFSIFRPNGELAEIRVKDRMGKMWSGYFRNPDQVIAVLKEHEELLYGNVFQIFNSINPACESRPQKDKILKGATATSDNDVNGRDWVFIDIDPIRPADTNATDEEEKYAITVARKVVRYLLSEGFREPVVIASANGAHVYLRCHLANTPENTKLVTDFIKALGMLFDDDVVKIDPAIFNAARMAKLPGTRSGKGREDDDVRPQRWCRFLKVPDEIIPTERAFFEKVASLLPEKPRPTQYNDYGREKFDLRDFFKKHNIPVKQEVRAAGGTRFILDHCLFNEQHRGKDAMIFQYDDGAIQYKCLHASCSQYRWRDVRLLYEPDAYASRQDVSDFAYKQRMQGRGKPVFVPQEETQDKGPIWLGLDEIPTLDPDSVESIATGIRELDNKIFGGTILQQLSVMTGRPSSGKSTILNSIMLSSIQQGYPTAIFSGELPNPLLKSWITLPAAGRNFVKASFKRNDSWYVPKDVEDKILAWLKGKLYVHNAEYGNNWEQLRKDIRDIVRKGVKNVILDNLMVIGLDYETDNAKLRAQINFINDLHNMVREENFHCWLVAHPRKQTSFLRFEDIAGASEIGNLADNIFLVHRINQDFENQAKTFFPKPKLEGIKARGFTNVVEIAKNRIPGLYIGDLVGVYYEPETKRMKNDPTEMFQYGWDTTPVQQQLPLAPPVEEHHDTPEQPWYNKEEDNELDF